jgi:hypothetical protein
VAYGVCGVLFGVSVREEKGSGLRLVWEMRKKNIWANDLRFSFLDIETRDFCLSTLSMYFLQVFVRMINFISVSNPV